MTHFSNCWKYLVHISYHFINCHSTIQTLKDAEMSNPNAGLNMDKPDFISNGFKAAVRFSPSEWTKYCTPNSKHFFTRLLWPWLHTNSGCQIDSTNRMERGWPVLGKLFLNPLFLFFNPMKKLSYWLRDLLWLL